MIFSSGHPFLNFSLPYLLDESLSLNNSLTGIFKSFCQYSGDIFPLTQDFHCHNSSLGLVTSEYFYPWDKLQVEQELFHRTIFDDDAAVAAAVARVEDSFTVNFYQPPANNKVAIGSHSLFARFAQTYCPLVYANLIIYWAIRLCIGRLPPNKQSIHRLSFHQKGQTRKCTLLTHTNAFERKKKIIIIIICTIFWF